MRRSVQRSEPHPDHPMADREQRLRLLLEVGRSLVSELELDVVLERVLEAGRGADRRPLRGDRRSRRAAQSAGAFHHARYRRGDPPGDRRSSAWPRGARRPDHRSQPLRLDDVGRHPRSYGFPPATRRCTRSSGFRSDPRQAVREPLSDREERGRLQREDEETPSSLPNGPRLRSTTPAPMRRPRADGSSWSVQCRPGGDDCDSADTRRRDRAGQRARADGEARARAGRRASDGRAATAGQGTSLSAALAGDLDQGSLG